MQLKAILARVLGTHLSLPAAAALAAVLAGIAVAVRMGALIEDLQLFFFPLVAALLWFIPKRRDERVPLPLVSLAVVLWLSTTAHFGGFVSFNRDGNGVLISRLADDKSGLEARSLYQRFNVIARTYHLLRAELIHRSFATDAAAREWLSKKQPRSPFLIRGDSEWLRLVFRSDLAPYLPQFTALARAEASDQARDLAASLSLKIGADVILAPSALGSPVAVVFQPEALQVPDEPSELSRHYLAWLAQGLRIEPDAELAPHAEIESRRDAFKEARLISGAWRSKAPLGLAAYYLGTLDLLEALDSGQRSPQLLRSARRFFRLADHYVDNGQEPELTAALYNNMGVVQLLQSQSNRHAKKARRVLHLALIEAGKTAEAPRGSRAALLNLLLQSQAAR